MSRDFPPRSALRDFLESESAGGMLLIFAAILAMIVANSPLGTLYHDAIRGETVQENGSLRAAMTKIDDFHRAAFPRTCFIMRDGEELHISGASSISDNDVITTETWELNHMRPCAEGL